MALYRKLAYAGSIWSLIVYLVTLVALIDSYRILYHNTSLYLDPNPEIVAYFSSIYNIGITLAIIGTATSIIIIIAIRKIKPEMKKLAIILIISAIVIAVSPYVAFTLYNNIEYPRDADYNPDPIDLAQQQAWRNRQIFWGTFALGIIPGTFITVSGIWALTIYRKSKL